MWAEHYRSLQFSGQNNCLESVRIMLKAHISLCCAVAPNGGKPTENTCVPFCFVLCCLFVFAVIFNQESE